MSLNYIILVMNISLRMLGVKNISIYFKFNVAWGP